MNNNIDPQVENFLILKIKEGNRDSFAIVFNTYYKDLILFAGNFIKEKSTCEDLVQNLFLKIWDNRGQLAIETSLKSYLLKSVRNACLDELRHQEIVRNYHETFDFDVLDDYDTENYILYSDLHARLNEALLKLPEKYREAFELNRVKGLKYREIASFLNVSERTVDVRIGKALQLLREYLKDFFILLLLLSLALHK